MKTATEDQNLKVPEAAEIKGRKRGFSMPGWLAAALISVAVSVLSIFIYDRFLIKKIVSMDIKGYIAEQRDLYLAGRINDEQFRANIDKLEARVKSIPSNQVVIMGDAVVKNAEIVKP